MSDKSTVLEKLKKMQEAVEKMSPEELSSRIDSVTKDESCDQYATLERFIMSGDKAISHKHVIVAKKDLVDGEYYKGKCRNAEYAVWVKKINKFIYMREKFGTRFAETINHPEDDDGYDLFLPFSKCSDVPDKNRVTPRDILFFTSREDR